MLELQKFLKEHPNDYEELLAEKPYAIKVTEDEELGLSLFKYNQIESDFNIPMVRECRGIILETGTWEIVCHPFHKFGNFGESYVPEIDWNSAEVQEKVDGCISSGELVSTDRGNVPIEIICKNKDDYNVKTYNFISDKEEFCAIEEVSIQDNNNDWYEIELDNRVTIKLTGNHRVWVENLQCYRRVDQLQGGEEVKLLKK